MAANVVQENTSLRLAYLQEAFAFLEEDHPFKCVQADDRSLRYESARVWLRFDHADPDGVIQVAFGPRGFEGQTVPTFATEDLAGLAEPPELPDGLGCPVDSWSALEDTLHTWVAFLQTWAGDLLRGDRRVFERLGKARRERSRQAGRAISQELAQRGCQQVQIVRTPSNPRLTAAKLRPLGDPEALGLLAEAERLARASLAIFLQPDMSQVWPACVRSLKPLRKDYAKVFDTQAAARARGLYEALWQGLVPPPAPRPGQTALIVQGCFAEWLLSNNAHTRAFPAGYRQVASLLAPGSIWLTWRYEQPGGGGALAFDGLAQVGGRVAWFPRPHRVLAG